VERKFNMGEAADSNIENGLDEYHAHLDGDCEYGCPYCEEENKRLKKKEKRDKL
jgi:hypothetical protein